MGNIHVGWAVSGTPVPSQPAAITAPSQASPHPGLCALHLQGNLLPYSGHRDARGAGSQRSVQQVSRAGSLCSGSLSTSADEHRCLLTSAKTRAWPLALDATSWLGSRRTGHHCLQPWPMVHTKTCLSPAGPKCKSCRWLAI